MTIKDNLTEKYKTRQYRHAMRKRLAGYCVYGGCGKPLHNSQFCEYHAKDASRRQRERRARKLK